MAALNVLTINSGSSSLKASLFLANGERKNYRYEHIDDNRAKNHASAFNTLLNQVCADLPKNEKLVIGHRFVHGGDIADAARIIDADERARLESITHLAPLHMPSNLLGVYLCNTHLAAQREAVQIACFDTAFHASLPEIAYRLPIPQDLGIRRFGFHGLNYAHITQCLPHLLGETAKGHIVLAHLGSGASLCLLENMRSIDTTMGYTAAGGIPMGTRSGDLDPGVMVELAKRFDHKTLTAMTYQQMGLLALSNGESSEMSELVTSDTAQAKFAVQYFVHQVRAAIGAFAAKVGGLDAIVFTGGIGEHSALVRAMICEPLAFMGFKLNFEQNQKHATLLSNEDSKPVLMIPADEEAEIYRLALSLSQT